VHFIGKGTKLRQSHDFKHLSLKTITCLLYMQGSYRDFETVPEGFGTLKPFLTQVVKGSDRPLLLSLVGCSAGSVKASHSQDEAVQWSPEVFLVGHFTIVKIFLKMFSESDEACEDIGPRGVDGP